MPSAPGRPRAGLPRVASPQRPRYDLRMLKRLHARNALVFGALGVVAIAVGLKSGAHALGWEILTLNALLSGIVAADVFLMGFLISGVLGDYKEAERLPGELAASLDALAEEGEAILARSQSAVAREYLAHVEALAMSLHAWFYKRERTSAVLERLAAVSRDFGELEPLTQVGYIVRMKQELHAIRRALIRAHTIRETSFIGAGYRIAEWTTGLLVLALILVKIEPFYESMFTVGVIVFLLSYLILLIRDLENPFGYYLAHSQADVSLKPLEDCVARLAVRRAPGRGGAGDGSSPG